MTLSIRETYQSDCLLVATALTNNQIETDTLEAANRLRDVVEHRPLTKRLSDAISFRIAEATLSSGLYFRVSKPLAIISGAGIAGLAASFELRVRGFNVVILEKRKEFSRFNVINLNVETQAFLKRFNLLEKFEKLVAARIKEHRLMLVNKNKSIESPTPSDVSKLTLDESLSFEPDNFHNLFNQEGIYSVPIKDLQTFLAENALEIGVNLFGNVTVILSCTDTGKVSKVQITHNRLLQPDLFFIAEGAHSTTARNLKMTTSQVINACTGENWIFGNMRYSGEESFVVSVIDTSKKTLRIANVIFNAKSKVINIAVTSEKEVSEDKIKKQIRKTAGQVCSQKEMQGELLAKVSKPVHVTNRILSPFLKGNVFCIGDSAGSSSPLAGLGGTLALTLVPEAVKRLLDEYEKQSENIHANFNQFSAGYTSRWIQKSVSIKEYCMRIFNKDKNGS